MYNRTIQTINEGLKMNKNKLVFEQTEKYIGGMSFDDIESSLTVIPDFLRNDLTKAIQERNPAIVGNLILLSIYTTAQKNIEGAL